MQTYRSTDGDISNLSFESRDELGALSIEKLTLLAIALTDGPRLEIAYMKLLRGLAQGSVVLLNKIPGNFFLGQIIAGRIGVRST